MTTNQAHTGRKFVDIAQKARGRTPLKYEFEVIPFFAGELPSGLDKLAFVWERGSKIFATEAEPVNPHTRAVFWKQYLRQVATLYKDNGRVHPKEYTFKIQHVRDSKHGGKDERKTVGKIKIDLATFCSEEQSPLPQEVFLQLKPAGKLKVSIKAAWVKEAQVDLDALTELSFTTMRSTEGGGPYEDLDEQDLSGFEEGSRRSSLAGDLASGASHSNLKKISRQGVYCREEPQAQAHSPRIPAAGTRPVNGSIPGFNVGPSPYLEAERLALEVEKQKQVEMHQVEVEKIRRTVEDALREELNQVLAAHAQGGWRAIFCCCLPQKQVRIRTTTELAAAGDEDNSRLLGGNAQM